MWWFKTLAVTAVILGALLLGVVVAYAGWSWNAQLSVEGVEVRTDWTVVDDQTGQSYDSESGDFHATITAAFAKEADVEVLAVADTETVRVKHRGSLECKPDGVEAEFVFKVSALEAVSANKVVATIRVGGQEIDKVTGQLDERLQFQVVIPADSPDCYDD